MKILNEFKQFLLRGNVVDLAVGVVVGAAFGTVVTSLVKSILTPLIGAIAKVPDFSGLVFTINGSRFMYGEFINALISFLLVSAAIFFFVIKPMNLLVAKTKKETKPIDPTTKKCTECLSEIPLEAKRCAHCTQALV
jgi:large conductance mechanosensitive channel